MNIIDLGWNNFFNQQYEQIKSEEMIPARISKEHKNIYHIFSELGEMSAELSGKYRHQVKARSDLPCVGDWVVVAPRPQEGTATIHYLLERKGCFTRKAAGDLTEEQVLAANIDIAFLVSALDNDFNLRRIERYITTVWDSGASPVIILNKIDLCDDLQDYIDRVEEVAFGIPICPISAIENAGIEKLQQYLKPKITAAFLGSSGVGKSTIINKLYGSDIFKTSAVREDDSRGRHTTSHREMIMLPEKGILIDTPGMRSVQLWSDSETLKNSFSDIEEITTRCKFNDCNHTSEPGCAVNQALEDGSLDQKRYNSYVKQQKELISLAIRKNQKESRKEARVWGKKIREIQQVKKELRKKGLA